MNDQRQIDDGPHARKNRARTLIRENWYRDVWLLAITVLGILTFAVGFGQIQESRRQSLIIQCHELNDRNVTAIETLDRLINDLPPARRKRAQDGRDFTVALIKALVPYEHDCAGRARRLTAT